MIKKLLLILSLSLYLFNPAIAGTLEFSHPSAIMECADQDSARHLAEVVQTRESGAGDVGTCLAVPGFGSPIYKNLMAKLILDSPVMEDWEGDSFAIFTFIMENGTTYWLLIYNPEDILNKNIVFNA